MLLRLSYFLLVAVFSCSLQAQSILSWSDPVDIAPKSAGNFHPRIVVDAKGMPVVLWGQSGTGRVRIARWNGMSFTSGSIINSGSMPAFYESWAGPDMAAKGDTICVVFKQSPEETNHVYFMRSVDGGQNFGPAVAVENIADSLSRFPTVCIDNNGNPLVAFMKFNSKYSDSRWAVSRSTDGGQSFLSDQKASGISGGVICDCCPATICTASNTVAVVYRANNNNLRDNWVGLSTDQGRDFTTGQNVDKNGWMVDACPGSGPDAVIIDDTLYTVFMSAASGKTFVYHNHCSIKDQTSNKSTLITPNVSNVLLQNYPRVASYGHSLAEVWLHNTSANSNIMMSLTNDVRKGYSTTTQTIATEALGSLVNADVAVSNNAVYVVYQDDATGTVRMRSAAITTDDVQADQTTNALRAHFNTATELVIENSSDAADEARVQLYTSTGRLICSQECSLANSAVINIPACSAGVYAVQVQYRSGLQRNVMVVKD